MARVAKYLAIAIAATCSIQTGFAQQAPLMPATNGAFGQGGGQSTLPPLDQLPPRPQQIPQNIPQPNPPAANTNPDEPSNVQPKLHTCAGNDIAGVWKLTRVLETPPAARTQEFKDFPFQYLWATEKGLLFIDRYNQDKGNIPTIRRALIDSGKGRTYQYVLGEKGVFYIYLNQAFSHSFYCAISEEAVGIYRIGDMLLTPTTPSASKLFEVYRKVISP